MAVFKDVSFEWTVVFVLSVLFMLLASVAGGTSGAPQTATIGLICVIERRFGLVTAARRAWWPAINLLATTWTAILWFGCDALDSPAAMLVFWVSTIGFLRSLEVVAPKQLESAIELPMAHIER